MTEPPTDLAALILRPTQVPQCSLLYQALSSPGRSQVHSVQLCLFANRLQSPTRKAIWIRTVCLAAAQRFSLKPAGSRWINRTRRYRLSPCSECRPCNCFTVLSTPIPVPCPWPRNNLIAHLALSLSESPSSLEFLSQGDSASWSSLLLDSVNCSLAGSRSDPGCCCLILYLRGVWSPLEGNDLDAFLVLLTSACWAGASRASMVLVTLAAPSMALLAPAGWPISRH